MADVQTTLRGIFKDSSEIYVAGAVVIIVIMMIIPLPAVLLDALMSINLVLSLMIILTILYIRNALEFTVFPTLLLSSPKGASSRAESSGLSAHSSLVQREPKVT
jgi:flagellar biosynthesis protein FlhA